MLRIGFQALYFAPTKKADSGGVYRGAAKSEEVAGDFGLQFGQGRAMLIDPPTVLPPTSLLADLDGMLARGVPPAVLGHWVAVNQSALLSALKLAATLAKA